MRNALIVGSVVLLTSLSSAYGIVRPQNQQRIEQQQGQQQKLQPGGRANGVRPAVRRPLIQEALYAFYVKQFQDDSEVSAEVLKKMLPFIDQFLQDRFEISERHNRALRELRQALNRNASEDELKRVVRDLDTADADFQANHEKFLNNVDPLLSPRLQAKVRMLQSATDTRIRQMLDQIQQNQAARRQNTPTAQ